jgi:hypothetical protein
MPSQLIRKNVKLIEKLHLAGTFCKFLQQDFLPSFPEERNVYTYFSNG